LHKPIAPVFILILKGFHYTVFPGKFGFVYFSEAWQLQKGSPLLEKDEFNESDDGLLSPLAVFSSLKWKLKWSHFSSNFSASFDVIRCMSMILCDLGDEMIERSSLSSILLLEVFCFLSFNFFTELLLLWRKLSKNMIIFSCYSTIYSSKIQPFAKNTFAI